MSDRQVTSWHARVLTLFPDAYPGPLALSVIGRALETKIWSLQAVDIRRFSRDKHGSVDDTPAGGGPGMVMRADVLADALDAQGPDNRPVCYLSPRGRRFDQATARGWAAGPGVVLICGRFEGVDQRVLDARGIEEISVGDFVLAGGDIAAMAMIEACVRLLPGVLGEAASLETESFENGLLEHPHYTRPTEWQGRSIPAVLLSGHHGNIAKWRRAMSEDLTRRRRPDLWAAYQEQQAKTPEE